MSSYLLSILILFPLVVAFLLLLIPSQKKQAFKIAIIAQSAIQLIFTIIIFYFYKHSDLTEKINWFSLKIESLGTLSIDYFLVLDELNACLVLLSSFILFIASIASWKIENNLKGYSILYLVLSSSIIGTFLSMNLFVFFIFFEFMLLPMYFLIGIWGGPRRSYAAVKFFLYTLIGSVFILISIIWILNSVINPIQTANEIGISTNSTLTDSEIIQAVQKKLSAQEIPKEKIIHSCNIPDVMDTGNFIPTSILNPHSTWKWIGYHGRLLVFLLIFIGFAIKIPIVPLHTWLPDAHVEAPTPVSIILASILLKIGGYGIIRIGYQLFPEGAIHFAFWIGLLGTLSILYGSLNALAMKDLKKMIAYSSIAHMGFFVLGLSSLTSEGMNGAMYQLISHGIISALLFLIAGSFYDRTKDRTISNYEGLAKQVPQLTTVVAISFFAALGLPMFSGFIGEFFILLGSFHADSINGLIPRIFAILAVGGVFLGAFYFIWTFQRMFFGKPWMQAGEIEIQKFYDLTIREKITIYPLIIITFILGILPHLLFNVFSTYLESFTHQAFENGNRILQLISSN